MNDDSLLSRFFGSEIFSAIILVQPGYIGLFIRLLHPQSAFIRFTFFVFMLRVHNLALHALKMQKNSMKVNRKCICFKIENYVSCRFRKIVCSNVDRRTLKCLFFSSENIIFFSKSCVIIKFRLP